MHSFTLHLPTELHFGADKGSAFAASAAKLGKHAFVVTGSGSVARLGYLAEVVSLLTAAGVKITPFTGIEPNPEAETVNRATAALRAADCDFVVAVGGGSAMDAAKAIAALAATPGEHDIWPFTLGGAKAFQLKAALPLACVATTAATASEVTAYSVISQRASHGKSVLGHEFLKPRVSWLNPAYTIAVPAHVTADGASDILSHVFENYLLGGDASPLADRHSEGVMLTVIETLPLQLASLADATLRGNLLWASTLALGGFQGAGRSESGFPMHSIEHSMSGVRPELAHGRGLGCAARSENRPARGRPRRCRRPRASCRAAEGGRAGPHVRGGDGPAVAEIHGAAVGDRAHVRPARVVGRGGVSLTVP
jgi:alcohol dehydrogenase YqhD (iron-dependent ADH family)